MTKLAIGAATCAVTLVVAAAAVVLANESDDPAPLAAVTSARTPSTSAPTTSTSSVTPTTVTPEAPGPLTGEDARLALPTPSAAYEAAALPVELASVCEGAAFDFVGATPSYASLQTTGDPLRYLDAVAAVYDTVPGATAAYRRIGAAVAACPTSRTATPTPTTATAAPTTVLIEGELRDVVIAGLPAIQWVQVQRASDPPTELRTVVTVLVVENAVVAISTDQDSETTDAEALAAVGAAVATTVAQSLITAAAT